MHALLEGTRICGELVFGQPDVAVGKSGDTNSCSWEESGDTNIG